MYLTDRKRAAGLGAAKSGTSQVWNMQVTSWALLVLVPVFVFTFGPVLGEGYVEALAYYRNPLNATIAAATILVTMLHFRQGVQTLIDDYVRGETRKMTLIAASFVLYGLGLLALISIARVALSPVPAVIVT